MDDPQLLPKLQQQNALLKKAVLQEQRRRQEADGALEQSRGDGAALRARVDELSELLAAVSSSQAPHAAAAAAAAATAASGSKGGEPGWLRKNLGWARAGDGAGQGASAPELAMLREELRAKAEENERLHMQLFERSQELEAAREDLHAARAELERRAGERARAPGGAGDQARARQEEAQERHAQQFWARADRLVAAAERSAIDAQSAMDAARVSCSLAWRGASLGDAVPRRSALLQEVVCAPAHTGGGGGAHAALTGGETPWWASGKDAERAAGLLEAVVPLLRQLMVHYTVHHCAVRERLQRHLALEGARAPTPGHARAARQLGEATERHHTCIAALHTNATSLRAALRAQGAQSVRRAGHADALQGNGAGAPGSADGSEGVEHEGAARAQSTLLQGVGRMKGVLRQVGTVRACVMLAPSAHRAVMCARVGAHCACVRDVSPCARASAFGCLFGGVGGSGDEHASEKCAHVDVHVHDYPCAWSVYVCTICVCIFVRACVRAGGRACGRAGLCTHTHTYTPTHLHTYTPTHLHTYTHTHVCVQMAEAYATLEQGWKVLLTEEVLWAQNMSESEPVHAVSAERW